MEPKIISKPAFMVVGMKYAGKNENQEISQMWGLFNPRAQEIKNVVWGKTYGVSSMVEGLEKGVSEYVAGLEVSRIEDLPREMVAVMVPQQRYAVFEHRGSLESLRDTYNYIHQLWLPKLGYRHGNGPELEVYDDKFKAFSPNSLFYIYVPVE